MIDVALGIDALLPQAEYFGSTTDNTKEAFDALDWQDERPKPTWKEVQDAYNALPDDVKNPPSNDEIQIALESKKQEVLAKLGLTSDEVVALLA